MNEIERIINCFLGLESLKKKIILPKPILL